MFYYRDTATADNWRCAATLDVLSQTGGNFSGDMGVKGTGVSEPACTFSFDFTASMAPDGTLTDFHTNGGLGAGGCTPSSDAIITGAVTNANMQITLTDRALCRDSSGNLVRDTDRTLRISLTRLSGTAS